MKVLITAIRTTIEMGSPSNGSLYDARVTLVRRCSANLFKKSSWKCYWQKATSALRPKRSMKTTDMLNSGRDGNPVLHLNFGRILVQIYRVLTFTFAEVTLTEYGLYSNYALASFLMKMMPLLEEPECREGGIPGTETWLRR